MGVSGFIDVSVSSIKNCSVGTFLPLSPYEIQDKWGDNLIWYKLYSYAGKKY